MPLSPKQNVLSETDILQLALRMCERLERIIYKEKRRVCVSPYSICCGGTSVTRALIYIERCWEADTLKLVSYLEIIIQS